jgi:hypothetical protein
MGEESVSGTEVAGRAYRPSRTISRGQGIVGVVGNRGVVPTTGSLDSLGTLSATTPL